MQFEVNDNLGERFNKALEKTGEDKTKVVERIFKTYVYDVFSREQETYYGLESFMRLPKKNK